MSYLALIAFLFVEAFMIFAAYLAVRASRTSHRSFRETRKEK